EKLASNYRVATKWAAENGVPYMPGVNAAFFLWVDLGAVFRSRNPGVEVDVDEEVMQALLKNRVFLASGKNFGSEVPGWFRIVFSQDEGYLKEGLERIMKAMGGSVSD